VKNLIKKEKKKITKNQNKGEANAMSESIEKVTIRGYPKVVFFYPLVFISLISAFLEWRNLGSSEAIATFWLISFLALLFVVAFEFTRGILIALLSLIFATAVLILYLTETGVIDFNIDLTIPAVADASFYLTIALILILVLFLTWVGARFNYWELTHQELLHKKGFLGDVDRWPAPNMVVQKSLEDIFEFLLLRSGRFILIPAGKKEAIVIDAVPKINDVERRIKTVLEKLAVKVEE